MAHQNASRRRARGGDEVALVQTRISKRLKTKLRLYAKAAYMSEAAYVRKVLAEHLDHSDGETP